MPCHAWGHPEINARCCDHPICKKMDEDMAQQLDIRCALETEDVQDFLEASPTADTLSKLLLSSW